MEVLKTSIAFITLITLSAIAGYMLGVQLDYPDVIYSYKTKECKQVIYADGTQGSCEKLPEKYNFIWGE